MTAGVLNLGYQAVPRNQYQYFNYNFTLQSDDGSMLLSGNPGNSSSPYIFIDNSGDGLPFRRALLIHFATHCPVTNSRSCKKFLQFRSVNMKVTRLVRSLRDWLLEKACEGAEGAWAPLHEQTPGASHAVS